VALQEQHVAFKFAGGVETKMDSKAVPSVRLLALENGVFSRAISIKKRNGYERLARAIDGSVSLISDAKRLAARDDELLLLTQNRCYSKQTGADQWTDAGALVAPVGSDRPVVHTGTAQTTPDHATLNGVTVYAWEDSLGGVYWTTVDAESGRVYRAPTQANASGQRPRCVANGDALHVYYAVPAQRQICVLVVNPSTPSAAVSELVVVDDLDTTNPVYDACATARAGTPAILAWHEYSTTNIRVAYVTTGGALGAPGNGHPSAATVAAALNATSPLAVAFDYVDGTAGDSVVLAYTTGTDGIVHVLTGGTTTAAIGAGGSIPVPTCTVIDIARVALGLSRRVSSAPTMWVVFEEANALASASQRYCIVNSVTVAGGPGTPQTIRSLSLASRVFQAGADEDTFAVFVHDTTYFNTYLTLRLSDFAPAGRHLPGSACGPTRSHVSSVHVDDEVATLVLPYKTRLASTNNDKFTESALRRITMDFDSEDALQTAQISRGLYLAAACPQHYDGRLWTEQGFHVGPEYVPTPAQGTNGSLTQTSTYQYKIWYEWTDGQGEIHRGPESIGISVTLTGVNDELTFSLPTLRVTRKSNVRICVARSLPGSTSRHWRVTSLDPTTTGATANGYIANDATVDTVTFVDRMSDADLQLQEEIYTVGGILSNDPVPLGSHVAAGKNRLFFTDAQAGNIVRYSKRIATGFGAEFAPELMHDVDPYGGDITALAIMDDVVYAFKASCIFAFNGDGAAEDGTNSGNFQNTTVTGFSSSQIITSDVGCTDPASIVLTPSGLVFKSAKGIYQLDRARQVSYVGAPVEAYNAQSVRRATVLPDRTAVLFLTDSGSSLYYDYLFQQWSTFTNHEGYDGAVVDNTYHYLRAGSVVYRETPGEYSDAGTRIRLRFETAWLHLLEHLQGFQRFWKLLLLGTWSSPHQLGVAYRLDYDEAWSDAYYLDATGDTDETGWITGDNANPIGEDPITGSSYGDGLYGDGPFGGTGPDVYQWRYGIYEAGQAIQFRFEDFEKAGLAGASFELTEMTIVGGVMKPDRRPFSGARST